jgi:hypothetical protein
MATMQFGLRSYKTKIRLLTPVKKHTHTQPMQYGWVQLAVKKQKNGSEGLERKYVHE